MQWLVLLNVLSLFALVVICKSNRMIYQKHIPKFPLSSYVESIIYIEGNNKGTGLPKTAMSLVFNLEDSFKLFTDKDFMEYVDYKKYWVAGLQTKPTNVESHGVSKMLMIQFKTLGAFMFLKEPLHHYTNKYVMLDSIFNREADETWEQLQEAKNIKEQCLIAEQFLYQKLVASKLPNDRALSAIITLLSSSSNYSIHEICKQINVSRKHLNNLSKQYIGVSPKKMASLTRLQTTLRTICNADAKKLTQVAYELEYFDQAHFNNDFKRFTDLKPTAYKKLIEQNAVMKIVPHFIAFK